MKDSKQNAKRDSKCKSNQKFRVLGLFSGGGGLEIGFAQSQFSIVASLEIVPEFCKTLSANHHIFSDSHKVFCMDIAKFVPSEQGITDIDFVIGGPPCQSFSAAGRRAGGVYGLNDLRGSLFWHYCRILKDLQPKGFLFENVRGILSANNKMAWQVILNSFSEIGYTLHYRVLDSAEYGVPQHRERVIMVGLKNCKGFKFPLPTHGPASKEKSPYVSAINAIKDLQNDSEEYLPYGGKYEKQLEEIPPGLNYLYFTEKMGHPEPKFAWRSRFSDFLYVADPNQPTKTLVAHPGKWAGPFHWKKRKFTIAELKRLFTFPDNYVLIGGDISKVRQLGNSVTPRLANIMARAVLQQVFDVPSGVDLADSDFEFDHDSRKGRKAKNTRAKVLPNSKLYGDQPSLFDNISKSTFSHTQSEKYCLSYSDYRQCLVDDTLKANVKKKFLVTTALKAGVWKICTKTGVRPNTKIYLELVFSKPVLSMFERIEVNFLTDDLRFIGAMWDSVDLAIQSSTSYDCIQKLYGHFTEPYPQFSTSVEGNCNDEPIFQFQKSICDYTYLAEYHKVKELCEIFKSTCKINEEEDIALSLRHIGYDVRTNQTNRTIADGVFRVCYPFTLSLSSLCFVKWREKGQHKTADKTSIPSVVL